MVTPLIPFVKQLRIYPHILFNLRVYRTFSTYGVDQKNLNSRFPRGLSFVAYLTSFIVNSAVSPWNIFLFVLTPAVSPRIVFLCVSSVVYSNFRGSLANNLSLRT